MRLILLLAASLLALPVVAQTHTHEGGAAGEHVVVLRDGPASGRAVVGGFTHFGFALVDKEGVPVRHEDATVTLIQNGVTLFQSSATHEYDGLFTLDVTFTTPGPYELLVESGTGAKARWNGTAVQPENAILPTIRIEVPATVSALTPAPITVSVLDGGTLVNHTDAMVEVRRAADGLLVHRTHLHTHAEPMTMELALADPGDYEVRVLGYLAFPTGRSRDVLATVAAAQFRVDAAPGGLALPRVLTTLRSEADGGDHPGGHYVLSLGLDPENRNGVFNHQRLSALVWDPEAQEALQHVNFKATVRSEAFTPFFSESLHEYDGHLEVLLAGLPPGQYAWTVEASFREWSGEATTMFVILPPVVPAGSGPVEVVITGAEEVKAGVPVELAIALRYPGGVLVPHSEVDFAVLPAADAAPWLAAKIHAHSSDPTATLTFPIAGEYLVVAEGDTLSPTASFHLDSGRPSFSTLLKLVVGEGPGLPLPQGLSDAGGPEVVRALPPLALAGMLAGLALAALRARR